MFTSQSMTVPDVVVPPPPPPLDVVGLAVVAVVPAVLDVPV